MVNPVIGEKIQKELGIETLRPEISETDEGIIELSENKEAPILTRDWDFENKHRDGKNHFGILFDPRMHHRNPDEIVSAIEQVVKNMSKGDLEATVVRLKRFY